MLPSPPRLSSSPFRTTPGMRNSMPGVVFGMAKKSWPNRKFMSTVEEIRREMNGYIEEAAGPRSLHDNIERIVERGCAALGLPFSRGIGYRYGKVKSPKAVEVDAVRNRIAELRRHKAARNARLAAEIADIRTRLAELEKLAGD